MLTGYTQGCFDVLHMGHIRFLRAAKAWLGSPSRLIVGVASDEFYEAWKPGRMHQLWGDRASVVGALEFVDLAVVYNTPVPGFPDPQYKMFKFDTFFTVESLYDSQHSVFDAKPWRTVYLPRTPGISSNKLKGLE